MRLDTSALALAAAFTTASVYAVCSLLVAVAPGSTTAAIGYVFHLDLTGVARSLTWGSFATGIVGVSLAVALVVALLGALYNRFAAGTLGTPGPSRVGAQHG